MTGPVDAIRARLSRATPGEWRAVSGRYDDLHWGDCGPAAGVAIAPTDEAPYGVGFFVPRFREADAEFIANARQDIETLLGIVDAVAKLHWRDTTREGDAYCRADDEPWPCVTFRALGPSPVSSPVDLSSEGETL